MISDQIEPNEESADEVTYAGSFKKGMTVAKKIHMDFELRQMTTVDMLDAELEISSAAPMNFKLQLALRQLIRVGSFHGPFTVNMIRKLHPTDFNTLMDGLGKVAKLGEDKSQEATSD